MSLDRGPISQAWGPVYLVLANRSLQEQRADTILSRSGGEVEVKGVGRVGACSGRNLTVTAGEQGANRGWGGSTTEGTRDAQKRGRGVVTRFLDSIKHVIRQLCATSEMTSDSRPL